MPAYLLLLSALRNLWHHKLHSLINLASLALGLTVFAFAFLYVKQELSFDRGWPDAERVHRMIVESHGIPGRQDGVAENLAARTFTLLTENFSAEIDQAARLYTNTVKPDIPNPESNTLQFVGLSLADPAFAKIFRFNVIKGSMEAVLQGPGFIAVEETIASRFPEKLDVGSRIRLISPTTMPNKPNNPVEYEVAAIYRLPKPGSSPASFSMITLLHDYSLPLFPNFAPNPNLPFAWNDTVKIWLTFKPGVDIQSLHSRLPDIVDREITTYNSNLKAGDHISQHMAFSFQPLLDLHFNPIGADAFYQQGGKDQTLTIAAIGILVLLVGCSNSISLSLAAVLERRRDIGIHKAVGALRNDILLQYLGESVLLALLALLPAIALIEWLLPVLRTLLRMPQQLEPVMLDFVTLGVIALVVGLASGAYPALVLAGVKPQLVLKAGGNSNTRGNHRLRTLLVGFQFCFAVMLMIGTLALFLQMQVLHNQPLGFASHNLLFGSAYSRQAAISSETIKDRLQKTPGVMAVTAMSNPPNMAVLAKMNARQYVNRSNAEIELPIHIEPIGADTLSVLQIPLLAGRTFDPTRDIKDMRTGRAADQAADAVPQERLILNHSAVNGLGFANPAAAIDQVIYQRNGDNKGALRETPALIVGVVEDSMYTSVRRKPGPEGYTLIFYPMDNFLLKFDDSAASTIQPDIKRVLQELTHNPQPFMQDVETNLRAEFTVEQNQSKLLLYCAGLALFLSSIGLYGLASFTMQRGIKEVGVRKVMGASVLSLTALYLWRYAKPVLIASVIASPVAVYFVLQWLQRFPYQLEKWWLLPLCLAACGTVMIIALLTVAGIVIKTSRSRPVESLRYE